MNLCWNLGIMIKCTNKYWDLFTKLEIIVKIRLIINFLRCNIDL